MVDKFIFLIDKSPQNVLYIYGHLGYNCPCIITLVILML